MESLYDKQPSRQIYTKKSMHAFMFEGNNQLIFFVLSTIISSSLRYSESEIPPRSSESTVVLYDENNPFVSGVKCKNSNQNNLRTHSHNVKPMKSMCAA